MANQKKTSASAPIAKKKYVKKNAAYWDKFKKGKAAKKKGVAKNYKDFYHRPAKDLPLRPSDNGSGLLNTVLYAIDLLTVNEKAHVFSRILGTDEVSSEQMWAITKILKP